MPSEIRESNLVAFPVSRQNSYEVRSKLRTVVEKISGTVATPVTITKVNEFCIPSPKPDARAAAYLLRLPHEVAFGRGYKRVIPPDARHPSFRHHIPNIVPSDRR